MDCLYMSHVWDYVVSLRISFAERAWPKTSQATGVIRQHIFIMHNVAVSGDKFCSL